MADAMMSSSLNIIAEICSGGASAAAGRHAGAVVSKGHTLQERRIVSWVGTQHRMWRAAKRGARRWRARARAQRMTCVRGSLCEKRVRQSGGSCRLSAWSSGFGCGA
eukprot:2563531-Prymnesium_polylepis.1